MTPFQHFQFIHLLAEVHALVSEREGMLAANKFRESCGDGLAYGEDSFAINAAALRSIVPDPHQFA